MAVDWHVLRLVYKIRLKNLSICLFITFLFLHPSSYLHLLLWNVKPTKIKGGKRSIFLKIQTTATKNSAPQPTKQEPYLSLVFIIVFLHTGAADTTQHLNNGSHQIAFYFLLEKKMMQTFTLCSSNYNVSTSESLNWWVQKPENRVI